MKSNTGTAMLLFLVLFCAGITVTAQHTLSIVVKNAPENHKADPLYIAGSFNGWNPSSSQLEFNASTKSWQINIKDLNQDQYEFKFTRGDWNAVQSTTSGADVPNNLVKFSADTVVYYSIAGWKDDFSAVPKQHTASSHVVIMDTAFAIPQLQTTRRIWIYLPEGYNRSSKRYPVLYLHDGQNVFDEYTSGFGEWGVDECLDSLIAKGAQACIVVGIDNGPGRLREYNPYDSEKFGKPEGDLYLNFLTETLKPFIDKKYRTLSAKENTIIAGSSMGGLISYYAMLKYPSVFGKAGIFSPAFRTAMSGIHNLTDSVAGKINGRFFFYAGGAESDSMIPDMVDVMDTLGEKSAATIYSFTDPESRHNEQAWRKWFPMFYLWITADGNNVIVNIKDDD